MTGLLVTVCIQKLIIPLFLLDVKPEKITNTSRTRTHLERQLETPLHIIH